MLIPRDDPTGQSLVANDDSIIPPNNSTIPPGKQLGPWTNSATDASPFGTPANMPPLVQMMISMLGRGGLYGAGGYLMGKAVEPQPLNQGENVSTNPWWGRPSGKGGMPGPVPMANTWSDRPSGQPPPLANTWSDRPSGQPPAPTPPMPLPRPPVAAAQPAARPAIDPRMVDLGFYRPSVGNARTPTFVPPGQTTAPPIYRGPMTTGGNRTPYYG